MPPDPAIAPSSPAPQAPSAPAPAPAAAPQGGSPLIPQSNGASTTPTPSQATPGTITKPDWLPDNFFDPAKGIKPEIEAALTRDAQAQIRSTQAFKRPEDVKIENSKGFVVPQGMEFKFDPNDPAWPAFKELAVKKGWTQDDASSVLDAYAAAEIAKAQKFNTALQSEREKLGANGTNRVTAVQTALKGEVGEELMTAMMAGVWTAKALEGFERLLSARMTQGAANFSQAHRTPEPSAPGRVSDDEYNRMSQAERWEYARSFNQSQFHDPNKMNGR